MIFKPSPHSIHAVFTLIFSLFLTACRVPLADWIELAGAMQTTSPSESSTRSTPKLPLVEQKWSAISRDQTPDGRYSHSSVWTGNQLCVWGGWSMTRTSGIRYLDDGGCYDPSSDQWVAMTAQGAPVGRVGASAVWTGTEMCVWGGFSPTSGGLGYLDSGACYDPILNNWKPITRSGSPAARDLHTAVWTGTEMCVWGGRTEWPGPEASNTGGCYNVAHDEWSAITLSGAPHERQSHSAVWTGTQMCVWGGAYFYDRGFRSLTFNDGSCYDPSNDSWTAISTHNAPEARTFHSAVWTGDQMCVWGGLQWYPLIPGGISAPPPYFNNGSCYSPATSEWVPMARRGAPSVRAGHAAIWNGSEVCVWGGDMSYSGETGYTGGCYQVSARKWTPTPILNHPAGGIFPSLFSTSDSLCVWGGYGSGYYTSNRSGGCWKK